MFENAASEIRRIKKNRLHFEIYSIVRSRRCSKTLRNQLTLSCEPRGESKGVDFFFCTSTHCEASKTYNVSFCFTCFPTRKVFLFPLCRFSSSKAYKYIFRINYYRPPKIISFSGAKKLKKSFCIVFWVKTN